MASYTAPSENLPIFDPSVFINDLTPITIAEGDKRYLRFPFAQGTEYLADISVGGSATFLGTVAFNDPALPTSTGVLPAPNTISTQIPTCDWVQQAITAGGANILANNNTWTGQNDFTISSYAAYTITQLSNDTTIANTQWVQSLIAYYLPIISGTGVATPLQSSLIYGRTPYTFDLNTATFNAVFGFGVLQQSFASSVINNTFAYSTQTQLLYSNQPQKPASTTVAETYPISATNIFNSVQLSGDGMYAIVCNDGLGTDGSTPYTWKLGTGFTTNNLPYGYWWDSALSLTGQYQIICSADATKGLYVSNDYGISWNENQPNAGVWTSVAVSASGKYMFACWNGIGLYYSNNYGVDWTGTSITNDWCNIICSATGQYVLAIPNFQSGTPNDCFLSIDYGVSWTSLVGAGVPTLMTITNCCMTDDGLMMAIFDSGGTAYQSFNYGLTWTSGASIINLQMMTGTTVGCKARFAQRNKYLLGIKSGTDPYYAEFVSNW